MEVLYPHCAGLDVHKSLPSGKRGRRWWLARHMVNGTVTREVKTFRTTTKDLLALSEWLASQGCTHVAMEATGVYWKPVWHILSDGDFTLVLANAGHVKNVPGRKTDVNDATWLADLMAHGLIRGSFVPDIQTQELRGLLRTNKKPRQCSMIGTSSCFGEGLELCRKAELGELGDQPFGFGFRGASIEVVDTEIAVRQAGFEHVINGGQDGGGDGADCFLRSAPAAQAMELRAVVAVLRALGGPGTLYEHSLQPRSTTAQARRFALAGTLWFWPGHSPAQEIRCPAVGKRLGSGVEMVPQTGVAFLRQTPRRGARRSRRQPPDLTETNLAPLLRIR